MPKIIDIDDVESILWNHDFNCGDKRQALFDVVEILKVIKEHSKVVNIVRCKDCEHYYEEQGSCNLHEERGPDGEIERRFYVTPNWFCADGEIEND